MKRSEVYVPLTLLPLWNTISSSSILTSDLDSFRLKKGKCAMKHGKMFSIFIILAILLGTEPALALDVPAQAPQIVETVYPTEDVVVADIVATQAPYSADPTGERDCTAVLQRAVDDCAANGGGTVFLPVGRLLPCAATGRTPTRARITAPSSSHAPKAPMPKAPRCSTWARAAARSG